MVRVVKKWVRLWRGSASGAIKICGLIVLDCETKRKVKDDIEIWARATGPGELSFTSMRRKTGPSAWNMLSLRCLVDTQAEIPR